jgi:uncharacterized repeat protein (TIGR04042 family)
MPEMRFEVRWPDGVSTRCYSPSLVIKDFFEPGKSYTQTDFLAKARAAYQIANERVRQRWGFGCSHAQLQLQEIEDYAARFTPDATIRIGGFEE